MKYPEDGIIAVDEFGVFFINKNSIDENWIKEKGYKNIVDIGVSMKNDSSIILAVKKGQSDASSIGTTIFDMTIGRKK